MTPENKQDLRDYVCSNTGFSLHSLLSNERIGIESFEYSVTQFDSDCTMITEWEANDNLRFQRHLAISDYKTKLRGKSYKVNDRNYHDN